MSSTAASESPTMPRRKGHGIPPTKRVKQPDAISRSAPLKNKLYNEIPVMTVKEEPIQMTVSTVPIKSEPPSIISDALHSKYLHKKFKKMATLLTEDSNVINGNHFILAPPEANAAGRYVCSYCKLACAKPSVLQKHIRAHTNERPYPCLPCGFAFKTKSNLYKHCRSRTHASKLEETGEKMPLVFDGDEMMSSEEDDYSLNVSNTAHSKSDNDLESKEEMPKTIYKPKYRFMEQPLNSLQSEKSDEKKENSSVSPRLQLKIPAPNVTPSVSTPSPFTSGSSPSPEFLHRHINKLISENQAIVETNDPFWSKKFLQRTNSSENNSCSSPLSTSPSPVDVSFNKKTVRHGASIDATEDMNCDNTPPKHSKLALALLRPQESISTSPGPDTCDIQPLNLSTSNKELGVPAQNRKRSYSEGFPERPPKQLKDGVNAVPFKLNNSVQDFRRFSSIVSESSTLTMSHVDGKKESTGSPHNPEGSIIKDLLLKARASPSISSSSDVTTNANTFLSLTPPVSDDKAYSPSSQFMCHLCKDPEGFGNAENLEIHQLYHCRGSESSSRSSLNSPSPHKDLHQPISPYRIACANQGPLLIAPSHPSPGPLLGSTPLVESYRTKSPLTTDSNSIVLRKRRFDTGANETRMISAATIRSLEELSKCPMRSNLQMFGGEVKILDSPGGEAKTLRIEPSNTRTSKVPSEFPLQMSSSIKEENHGKESGSNIVVTIAKHGLHSGGSILEVPHKLKINEQQSFHQVPTSKSRRSASPGSHYPETNKVLMPVIPQVMTPIHGMSTPGEHPFIPFTSILTDSTVINPLTNITAYNPLTLPPAPLLPPTSPGMGISSSYPGAGIITIFHGGKEIPFVPGMPGPHTLLHNPVPMFISKLDSDVNQTKLSDANPSKLKNHLESTVHNTEKTCPSVINKPSSLSIPTIQVNSETVESPIDGSSSGNFRKRSVDETPPTPPKRSQGFTLPTESEIESELPTVEKKFLRPTSLPLKPGTFVPKRQQSTPVLSLVSPETPRPRKSYGQLYLNGHAYTYLGLKCSTRMFFCTLNKPQPLYVPLSPEHNKVSMYSNWKVCTEADPNPCGLDPGRAMALYDSRHRPLVYTSAQSHNCEVVTHSSYWTSRPRHDESSRDESADATPKRVKIFAGGFESNEDYIYIRGRGRGRYVCEECGIRCKKPSMLKKHIRTHTDVRPYTCIHCKFSFKTKGNLTKHMKSKAHYKKCIDLGILPVPTVVDDSYVDEKALAHQQALREERGVDLEESDEEDEEEEESDEEDDEEDETEGENCVEREAARSLLTLSETLQSATQQQHARAGLLPLRVRPSTYPYNFTQPLLQSTPTPTPTATVHSDIDKVSHGAAVTNEMSSQMREAASEGEFGVTSRYFPIAKDSRDSPGESSTRVKQSTPMDLSNKPSEKNTRVCEAAMLLASLCSTMERLPVATTTAPVSEDSTLLQAYLTERAVQDTRIKQQYQHKAVVEVEQRAKAKPTTVNISAAKENALGILAQTSSDARKLPTSEQPVAASKPQAEFLPPSSGPSPSYVSILEDGRSMCNMCNKVFSKPSQLRLHVNIHYFERPFRCEPCAVSFRTKGHLQKHQRSVSHLNKVNMNSTFGTATTTNPRPFKCDDCKIAFRIHGHLAKHLRSKMHIMKLECLGKLPFGTYAELERSGINMNDIDTTDCENSLESLQLLAQKLYEKDPSKLGQWNPSEMMPQHGLSPGDTSSEGEDDDVPCPLPSGPVLSPVQRLPPPPIQKANLSQCNIEPLKCVINIRNSPVSVSLNHKGPKHKVGELDEASSVSDRRTGEPGEGRSN